MSNPPDAPDHVTLTVADDVATVAIDDGKANALSHAVLAGVEQALDQAMDAGAKVVVIEGRDGKFSAGFDLSVMTSGATQARDMLGRGAELGLRLYELPIPVVFAVTGHALAMGGILQCCADVRIGAAGPYKVGLPEVRIGMPVPAFAVELCRDRLTPRWFTRSVLLGQSLSPEQALEAGFFDEVVELDQVRPRARAVAVDIAENVGSGPFRATRPTVRGALAQQLRDALAADLAAFNVES
jgi:enoyl-CoA hydratase